MIRRDGELSLVSHQEAYDRAAEMLRKAQKPLLYGWASTVCEAQKKGLSGATPGQVKNRADTNVFCSRFTSEGREGRKIVVVAVRETRTSKNANREKCGMRVRGDAGDLQLPSTRKAQIFIGGSIYLSGAEMIKGTATVKGKARILPSYQKTEIISMEGEDFQKYVGDLVERGAGEVIVRVGSS